MRKAMWILCMAVILVAAAPTAEASGYPGSLQVDLEVGELAVTNGAVTLYQVGVRTENGYQVADDFGGGMVSLEDTDSNQLAMWLAESAAAQGTQRLLDADGNTIFSDLAEGLYLLVQTERMEGFYPINPILLTIPEAESWDVKIYREPVPVVTELPQTGQSPILFFGILGMVLSSLGLLLCVCKERKS